MPENPLSKNTSSSSEHQQDHQFRSRMSISLQPFLINVLVHAQIHFSFFVYCLWLREELWIASTLKNRTNNLFPFTFYVTLLCKLRVKCYRSKSLVQTPHLSFSLLHLKRLAEASLPNSGETNFHKAKTTSPLTTFSLDVDPPKKNSEKIS